MGNCCVSPKSKDFDNLNAVIVTTNSLFQPADTPSEKAVNYLIVETAKELREEQRKKMSQMHNTRRQMYFVLKKEIFSSPLDHDQKQLFLDMMNTDEPIESIRARFYSVRLDRLKS
nr:hypothetical protein TetV2_00248 [Oceanusvirus sp.]